MCLNFCDKYWVGGYLEARSEKRKESGKDWVGNEEIDVNLAKH